MSETAPMRPGEELPIDRLAEFLGTAVTVEQFPGGHSNLTYLVRTPDAEFVLRRPPVGPVPPKAHDMAREYRVLAAVHPHFPPAPRPIRLCEDPSILGTPFYLMERRQGILLRDPAVVDAATARRASQCFVDCLADLHAVLVPIGKAEGFLDRQVQGWTERWRQADTPDRPDLEPVIEYLAGSIPASGVPGVVHNDFKLDNVLFAAGVTQISAVLDWEMTTLGDPLADLGLTLCYWTMGSAYRAPSGPGWFSRDELVERYARRTGRDVRGLGWYETLGVFKLAVILQQIYVRWVRGQTRDDRFRDFGGRVSVLAQRATELLP